MAWLPHFPTSLTNRFQRFFNNAFAWLGPQDTPVRQSYRSFLSACIPACRLFHCQSNAPRPNPFIHQDHSQILSNLCFSGSTQTCMLIMQFKPHQASCIPLSAVSYGHDLLRASWQWWELCYHELYGSIRRQPYVGLADVTPSPKRHSPYVRTSFSPLASMHACAFLWECQDVTMHVMRTH